MKTLPVDLDLHVGRHSRNGELYLKYHFYARSNPVGFFSTELDSTPLHQVEAFQKELYQQLGQLHSSMDADDERLSPADVERDLASLGQMLYERLFPATTRQPKPLQLAGNIESLRIFSEEPWIPWELMRQDGQDFFAVRFRLGQWLSSLPPVTTLTLQRLAILGGNARPPLPEAEAEAAFLASWAEQQGITVDRFPGGTLEELEAFLLAERRQWLHIITHGEFNEKQPDESKLLLTEPAFRSRHLTGAVVHHLRRDRPFVFASACEVGRLGWTITGIGGWAERWLRCGCSGFIGPRWSVGDGRAREFAELFYRELGEGRIVGEAVRRARLTLKGKNPSCFEWLTYCLFAHPNLEISLADEHG